MARFIGFLKGSRGEVSRLGTPASGMSAEARGWNVGGKVYCNADEGPQDTVQMSLTGGSKGADVPYALVQANGQSVSAYLESAYLVQNREGEMRLRAPGRFMLVQIGEGGALLAGGGQLFESVEAARNYCRASYGHDVDEKGVMIVVL